MATARDYIDHLQLQPHPEGGWYREVYRATESIARAHLPARFTGDRCFATGIYYLLHTADVSALHRIRQDEGWHHYDGSPLTIHLLTGEGDYSTLHLGKEVAAGQRPQLVVPAGVYFAATVDEADSYTLAGCTVAPGFDFADFEMPTRAELLARFPHQRDLIERLGHSRPGDR